MDSFRVVIKAASVTTKSGVSSKTGKPYSFHTQAGVLSGSGLVAEGVSVSIPLESDQPLSVGVYRFDPKSIYVDRWGGIKFGLRLSPVGSVLPAAAVAQAAEIPF